MIGKDEVLDPKMQSFLANLPRSAKNFFLVSRSRSPQIKMIFCRKRASEMRITRDNLWPLDKILRPVGQPSTKLNNMWACTALKNTCTWAWNQWGFNQAFTPTRVWLLKRQVEPPGHVLRHHRVELFEAEMRNGDDNQNEDIYDFRFSLKPWSFYNPTAEGVGSHFSWTICTK